MPPKEPVAARIKSHRPGEERARRDFDHDRGAADRLAVDVDAKRLVGVQFDASSSEDLDVGVPDVPATPGPRKEPQHRHSRRRADEHDVEDAVLDVGRWCDAHSTAERRSVGDAHQVRRHLVLLAVDREPERVRAHAWDLEQGGDRVLGAGPRPSQPVGADRDLDREPERHDRRAPTIADPDQVDRRGRAQRPVDRVIEIGRQPESAREVVARTGRHHPERHLRRGCDLDALMDRAVPADDDQPVGTGIDRGASRCSDDVGRIARDVLDDVSPRRRHCDESVARASGRASTGLLVGPDDDPFGALGNLLHRRGTVAHVERRSSAVRRHPIGCTDGAGHRGRGT